MQCVTSPYNNSTTVVEDDDMMVLHHFAHLLDSNDESSLLSTYVPTSWSSSTEKKNNKKPLLTIINNDLDQSSLTPSLPKPELFYEGKHNFWKLKRGLTITIWKYNTNTSMNHCVLEMIAFDSDDKKMTSINPPIYIDYDKLYSKSVNPLHQGQLGEQQSEMVKYLFDRLDMTVVSDLQVIHPRKEHSRSQPKKTSNKSDFSFTLSALPGDDTVMIPNAIGKQVDVVCTPPKEFIVAPLSRSPPKSSSYQADVGCDSKNERSRRQGSTSSCLVLPTIHNKTKQHTTSSTCSTTNVITPRPIWSDSHVMRDGHHSNEICSDLSDEEERVLRQWESKRSLIHHKVVAHPPPQVQAQAQEQVEELFDLDHDSESESEKESLQSVYNHVDAESEKDLLFSEDDDDDNDKREDDDDEDVLLASTSTTTSNESTSTFASSCSLLLKKKQSIEYSHDCESDDKESLSRQTTPRLYSTPLASLSSSSLSMSSNSLDPLQHSSTSSLRIAYSLGNKSTDSFGSSCSSLRSIHNLVKSKEQQPQQQGQPKQLPPLRSKRRQHSHGQKNIMIHPLEPLKNAPVNPLSSMNMISPSLSAASSFYSPSKPPSRLPSLLPSLPSSSVSTVPKTGDVMMMNTRSWDSFTSSNEKEGSYPDSESMEMN